MVLNPAVKRTLRVLGVEARLWGQSVVLRAGVLERILTNPRDAEVLRVGYGLKVEWEKWRGPALSADKFEGV